MIPARVADDRHIPYASKVILRRVRKSLKFMGVAPVNPVWRMTWEWATKVAQSYTSFDNRLRYPQVDEIATQYLTLLLAYEKKHGTVRFKLPFRAGKCVPPSVAAVLPIGSADKMIAVEEAWLDSLLAEDEAAKPKPLPLTIDVKASPPPATNGQRALPFSS